MDQVNTARNMVILASAADLVRCLVMSVAGNEIANTVVGKQLSGEVINEFSLTVFKKHIDKIQ